jgi:hypothetical protein
LRSRANVKERWVDLGKYIGETEKQLGRIFHEAQSSNCILRRSPGEQEVETKVVAFALRQEA